MVNSSVIDRILRSVRYEHGCWVWTKSKRHGGYGQVNVAGKNRRVHRVVYEALVGPVPAGMQLDHRCRRPECCSPLCLEPVTVGENTKRGVVYDRRSAKAASRTHCVKGLHERTEANTYIAKNGSRCCLDCKKIAEGYGLGPGRGTFNREKTHCPKGHEYTPENTYVCGRGTRRCRECNRLRVAAINAAKRQRGP